MIILDVMIGYFLALFIDKRFISKDREFFKNLRKK